MIIKQDNHDIFQQHYACWNIVYFFRKFSNIISSQSFCLGQKLRSVAAAWLSLLERRRVIVRVDSSMPTLGKARCCVLGKDTVRRYPNNGGAAQWVRAQVSNHKAVDSLFGSWSGQCIVVSLGKTLHAFMIWELFSMNVLFSALKFYYNGTR